MAAAENVVEEDLPEVDMPEEDMVEEDMVEESGILTSEDQDALTALATDRGMTLDDAALVVEIVEEFLGGGMDMGAPMDMGEA